MTASEARREAVTHPSAAISARAPSTVVAAILVATSSTPTRLAPIPFATAMRTLYRAMSVEAVPESVGSPSASRVQTWPAVGVPARRAYPRPTSWSTVSAVVPVKYSPASAMDTLAPEAVPSSRNQRPVPDAGANTVVSFPAVLDCASKAATACRLST